MDGSTFRVGHVESDACAIDAAPRLEAVGLALPALTPWRDRHRHWVCLAAAAGAHLALMAWVLPRPIEEFGDGGTALETIAVSIVGSLTSPVEPEVDAKRTEEAPSEDRAEPADSATDQQEAARAARPPLTIDMPPEEIAPDAPALPSRQHDEPPPQENATQLSPDRETPMLVEPTTPEKQERQDQKHKTEPPAPPLVSVVLATKGIADEYGNLVSEVIRKIRPLTHTRFRGQPGSVHVNFVIDHDGRPDELRISVSSDNRILDEHALNEIRRMRFPPPPQELPRDQRSFTQRFDFKR